MPLSRANALQTASTKSSGDDVAGQVTADELGDDLGVGVAVEDDAFAFELALEGGVVLDDAVVDDGDEAVAAEVGVGVAVVGGAVRGPARVADAGAAGGGPIAEVPRQVLDAAGALAEVQLRAGQRGQAGAVVAAVLQPAQAVDEDRFRFTAAGVADDAAHACSSVNGDDRGLP